MAWVKVDDHFPDHPKVAKAGPMASWLYVCGLAYCNRYLTDGFIPAGQVRKLADVEDAPALAQRLMDAGLWEEVDGGYAVHDYLDYQPSREHAQAISQVRAEAGSRGGKQRGSNLLASRQATAEAEIKPVPVPVPSPVPDPDPDEVSVAPPAGPGAASPVGDGLRDLLTVSLAPMERAPALAVPANGRHPPAPPPWPDVGWMHDSFEATFWPIYPRKTHKAEAKRAWVALMRRQPTFDAALALAERILEVLSEQREHWTEPAFTPHPASYLNGERWTDELIVPTGPAAGRRAR